MLINKKIMQTILLIILFVGCNQISINNPVQTTLPKDNNTTVKTGLDVLMEKHFDKLNGKKVALVTNHSGLDMFGKSNVSLFMEHDSINLVKIFTPEHGFTGNLPAGEHVDYDSVSSELPPILSLYGKTRKPSQEMLTNVDLIIYDIQDVGVRFYTYISTLGLVIEAAGEANIPVMILDRPNPIGNKIEGPVLDIKHKSFIGHYPIPIRYGMTIGELGKMIIGEKMINPISELLVIPMEDYSRNSFYNQTNLPWTNPSPNIPNLETAIIYPGYCLFESTNISEGRGTHSPFKQIGAPWIDANKIVEMLNSQNLQRVEFQETEFTPISIPSMSKYPKHENEKCFGIEINITNRDEYNSILTGVATLWTIYKLFPDSLIIKKESLGRIWGSDTLFEQLKNGKTPREIVNSYQNDLSDFLKIRKKYLIYN